ncbi:sorting nexin-7 [Gadus morhua]|uniref:sorting nexin-7 n=1 Tax=Gadus morhua TaxID=8049 RepID=UPI0011B5AF70|nr:sorting nexin-7 [Gadus morhua]
MSAAPVLSGDLEEDLDLEEDEDLEVFSKNPSLAVGSSVSSSVVQGSLVHSPGALVRSSGSMVNQYGLEEEEEEEEEEARGGVPTRDLFVTVDHPESHVTAIETFIVYRVLARTTRGDFDSSEYEVHRRYQDFLWLRGKLEEGHPTLIIHPLPEKFVMKGLVERFSEDFIETRRRALQTFLSKTAEHPMLSRSPQLKVFLTEQDLTAIKKQGPSFLSRMGDSVRAAAIAVRGVRARPQEFGAMQDYADEFSCKMSALDKVTQRIIKEQNEYLEELSQYGPLYSQWAELEADLSEPLRGVAGCLDLCGRETEEQLRHLTEVLQPTLHQYLLCADTLKTVLRRRDHIQAEFEAKNDALASSAVSKKGDLETLKEEAAGLEERVESANSALKGDWARWGDAMRYDLREALVSTADKNQDYYEKCLAVWETFLLSQKTPPGQEED